MTTDQTRSILSLNAFEPGDAEALDPGLKALVARRQASYGPSSLLFYREPLNVVKAEGNRILTADGRSYVDFYNNVASVGHCNPRVADAVHAQMLTANSHSRYLYDICETYSERLLTTFPAPLAHVTFTCTGSEANDLALRIARSVTGGHGVVVTRGAYHGNTAAVTEVSPSSYKRGLPPAFVKLVEPPSREAYGDDIAGGFTAAVDGAIAELKAEGHGFAALLVDSIFSSDGVFAEPAGFLKGAVDATRAGGGLVIADEVQPGFARTGDGMWGFLRHSVVPDIVTMGKPMGNGFPIGGVVTRPGLLVELQEQFGYFNTFGGTPAAAAAGLAVLDAIEADGLMENARVTGAYLRERLQEMAASLPVLSGVRGAGLYLGVSITVPKEKWRGNTDPVSAIVNGLKDEGVLIGVAGLAADVLKIRPPLVAGKADADTLAERLETVLARLGLAG
ncbi:aspartate aminotransferase family protein [Ensifer soli]|uniref:aspartate aminotransferase family protein n=1 Tax=Ciceribacter sp. sgz301302 TaxID=3342379 RepID=UPI0035BA595F